MNSECGVQHAGPEWGGTVPAGRNCNDSGGKRAWSEAGRGGDAVRLESCQRGGLFLASGTHQVSVVKESQAEAAGWMVTPFSKSRDGEGEKKGDEERTVQEGG